MTSRRCSNTAALHHQPSPTHHIGLGSTVTSSTSSPPHPASPPATSRCRCELIVVLELLDLLRSISDPYLDSSTTRAATSDPRPPPIDGLPFLTRIPSYLLPITFPAHILAGHCKQASGVLSDQQEAILSHTHSTSMATPQGPPYQGANFPPPAQQPGSTGPQHAADRALPSSAGPASTTQYDKFCIIHIATTCDEHGVYVTKDSAEVIEIGWVVVDARDPGLPEVIMSCAKMRAIGTNRQCYPSCTAPQPWSSPSTPPSRRYARPSPL